MALPYEKIKFDQSDRDQWLSIRKQGVGGSDAGVICGVNPYKTPHELYLEKRDLVEEVDLTDNQAVHFGNILEDIVAEEYARRTGNTVKRNNHVLRSKALPFMQANLDREIVGQNKILECKTAGRFAGDLWGDSGTDIVPDSYFLQVQHYMAVTGSEEADLAVLIGGQDFRIYTIPRSEDIINTLVKLESDFWEKVTSETPPPIEYEHPKTGVLLDRMYPGTNGKAILGTEALAHWAAVEREAGEKEAQYKKIKDGAKNHIRDFMGENSILVMPDGTGYTRKLTKKKAYEVEASESVVMRYTKDAGEKAEKLTGDTKAKLEVVK